MKISLLMPLYNLGERAIDVFNAVNNLEMPEDCEVVMLDDGSDDGSSDLFEEINAATDRYYYRSYINQGRSKCRNALANHARGEWLIFVDGDCTFDPLFLHRWVKILEGRKTDHSIIGRVNYEGVESSGFSHYLQQSGPWNKKSAAPLSYRYFATGHVCIPAKKFKAINGFNSSFNDWGGEDYDMGARLHRNGVWLDFQTKIGVKHPPVGDVKSYMRRMKNFAQTGLRVLLENSEEDFFMIKKYRHTWLRHAVKLPGLESFFLNLLAVDRIRWPVLFYRILIFVICMKYSEKV